MDKKEAEMILKMMFRSKQMKNAVKAASPEEEAEIFVSYDDKFPKMIFKMTRFDHSFRLGGDPFSKERETWILDADRKMGYYVKYGDGKISAIIEMNMKEEPYEKFVELLRADFANEAGNTDIDDGEAWEMVLYEGCKNAVHRIYGYIYGNEYLNKIAEFLKNEHQLSRFM